MVEQQQKLKPQRVPRETEYLLSKIKTGTAMTASEQLKLVLNLSLPAVMAQIMSIIMQYIDASMVGQLGAAKSASIGLVSTSTWLFGGLCMAAAPFMMSLLTPDPGIQELGVRVLRIEAFAEPLFAASIVVSGALRGAEDTLIPSLMNFISMWFVRLTLAVILSVPFGLTGVWIAMCIELCFRGIIFLHRLFRERWLK